MDTTEKNKIKPDTILKNFWRDNRHFADLFNAVFFNGEQVLKPAGSYRSRYRCFLHAEI